MSKLYCTVSILFLQHLFYCKWGDRPSFKPDKITRRELILSDLFTYTFIYKALGIKPDQPSYTTTGTQITYIGKLFTIAKAQK